MLQKITSFILIAFLFGIGSSRFVYAADTKEETNIALAAKVKEEISKLGNGENARIEVKLRDKTKIKGFISETGEDGFVVVNTKTGESTNINYSSVKQVKGNNLNSGIKIAIIAAVAVAAFLIFVKIGFAGATDH